MNNIQCISNNGKHSCLYILRMNEFNINNFNCINNKGYYAPCLALYSVRYINFNHSSIISNSGEG